MNVPFAITAAIKDLRRRIADPAALLIWIGMPVVLGVMMSLVSSGDGPAPKAHVLLLDQDKTFVSGLIANAGGQSRLARFLEIESVDEASGRKRIDAGDGTALLIVPKGFQDAILREQPATLTLVTNPAQRILPRIVEEGLRLVIEAVFYAQRLFGPAIEQARSTAGPNGPTDDAVAAVSRTINQRLRSLQDTLLPPVLSLETKSGTQETPGPGFWALFLPGLLFMALMFTAQGMCIDVWTEKSGGTLRRTLTTPRHVASFLAGKLVAGVVIMACACLAALILGVTMFGVSIARAPMALVWTSFVGAALFCYLLVLQVVSTNARGAQLLSNLIVFPLIMIGGSFFPFEAMPAWMANIGRWTPNGLGVMEVKQILFGAIDLRTLLLAAAGIGAPALLAFWLGVKRLSGAFAVN